MSLLHLEHKQNFANLGSFELLHAHFNKQHFAKHYHDSVCIGVIEQGELGFYYRGKKHTGSSGLINLCNPAEVHDGFSKTGWRYRMFYLECSLFAKLCAQIETKEHAFAFFKEGLIHDKNLAPSLRSLHICLQEPSRFLIEQEELFIKVFTHFIQKHADKKVSSEKLLNCDVRIQKAKELMQARLLEDFSVEEIAKACGLSLYYFIRLFQKQTGLSPKTYILQARINKAKKLLSKKHPLSMVALECGFYDQSHLHKYFKSYTGYTPNHYQKQIITR